MGKRLFIVSVEEREESDLRMFVKQLETAKIESACSIETLEFMRATLENIERFLASLTGEVRI